MPNGSPICQPICSPASAPSSITNRTTANNVTCRSLDLLAALHNLTCQIQFNQVCRDRPQRLGEVDIRDASDVRVAMEKQPFYRLTRVMLAVEAAHQAVSAGARKTSCCTRSLICVRCSTMPQCTDNVFAHLGGVGYRCRVPG